MILSHSGDPNALTNFISWIGEQLTEEIASGAHFSRDALVTDRLSVIDTEEEEELLFSPKLYLHFQGEIDQLVTPLKVTITGSPSMERCNERIMILFPFPQMP